MSSQTSRLTLPVGDRDHIQGSADAHVTLVEYGDFECSHCGKAYPMIKELQQYLGNRLRFVYRHFPISTVHPHAKNAAEVSEVAGAQGKFWEMHDQLFEHQDALDDESLRKYAMALSLNIDRFDQEMNSHIYANRVREDFLSGVRSGANGTPTFFINGVRYNGPLEYESLLKAVEEQLSK